MEIKKSLPMQQCGLCAEGMYSNSVTDRHPETNTKRSKIAIAVISLLSDP